MRLSSENLDLDFQATDSVNYQGSVIVFARETTSTRLGGAVEGLLESDIQFNVLAMSPEAEGKATDWTGFETLYFPDEIRPAGMEIINVPSHFAPGKPAKVQDAGGRFRVLASDRFIYMFRQSTGGTLLVTRFRLLRQGSKATPLRTSFSLDPVWEVRFQLSGKPDTPASKKDVQNYLSLEKEPFYEPTFELSMVKGIANGNFDVEFVPGGVGGRLVCHIFVLDTTGNKVSVYSLPLDEEGRFDLSGLPTDNTGVLPTLAFDLKNEETKPFILGGSPSLEMYLKQESVSSGDKNFYAKRSGRLLFALSGHTDTNPNTLLTVDFAIANDGMLARPPSTTVVLSPVEAAPYSGVFDRTTYIAFDPVALPQTFCLRASILPQADNLSRQSVLGDRASGLAWLDIVDGTRLEIGIGSAATSYLCTTPANTIRKNAWSDIEVRFDGAAATKFEVFVNGSKVTSTCLGDGAVNSSIDTIGGVTQGFVGNIDDVRIYGTTVPDPASLLAGFALTTIEYTDDGKATTPNDAQSGNPGIVHGVYLVPSTSPVANEASGTPIWDGGLTIYAGYFKGLAEYGEINSSPVLFSGSDGLIHCYFQGKSSQFCVMQYDTRTTRAVFESAWTTVTGPSERGAVQFILLHAGAALNSTTIAITDPTDASLKDSFCDLVATTPLGGIETWLGVPRSLDRFVDVLGGQSAMDPSDHRLTNGATAFFDVLGKYHAAYLPIPQSAAASMLAVVDRYPDHLALNTVEFSAPTGEIFTGTLTFDVSRWGKSFVQQWPNLPTKVGPLLDVLAGRSNSYDYEGESFSLKSYSLSASSSLPSGNRVVTFVDPTIDSISKFTVEDDVVTEGQTPDPLLCFVRMEVFVSGVAKKATWAKVPRSQVVFASVLEGESLDYNYASHAAEDWEVIGDLLLILTDGMDASVVNRSATPVPDNGMLVGAGLFNAFVTSPLQDSDKMGEGNATAGQFQKALLADGGLEKPLLAGSTMFRAYAASKPNSGGAAAVSNTTSLTDGVASLIQQGANGGWIEEADRRTLGYNYDNWVSFAVKEEDAPNIGRLTIPGDLTLEMWCNPKPWAASPSSNRQRLLTFSRQQTPDVGEANVQYLAGLRPCPSLRCSNDTNIRTGVANEGNGTFLMWFCPNAAAGAAPWTIASLRTIGTLEGIVTITLNAQNQVVLSCPISSTSTPIVSSKTLKADEWHQVGFTIETSYASKTYTFKLAFYLDGHLVGSQTCTYATSSKDLQMAAIVVGGLSALSETTLPMNANEVAFIDAIYGVDEIREFAGQRVPDSTKGLLVKWPLDHEGSKAVNTAPTGAANDGQILPSAAWNKGGLYSIPVLGYGGTIGTLNDLRIIPGWSHLAMVRQAGYALRLDGAQYADCGNDYTLQAGDKFSVEAWVQLDTGPRRPQAILAKGEDYRLYLGLDGKPRFDVKAENNGNATTLTVVGPKALDFAVANYLAVTYEQVTVAIPGPGEQKLNRYEIHLTLFQNGEVIAKQVGTGTLTDFKYNQYETSYSTVSSDANLNLGRTTQFGGAMYLKGDLADVRLWNRVLHPDEVRAVFQNRRVPSNRNGLVSWWRFEDSRGKIVLDKVGNNNATLSLGAHTINYEPTAAIWFYVDGIPSQKVEYADGPASVGGYGSKPQFYLGQVSDPAVGFYGQLDEVRIWDAQLTNEQLTDSMYRSLAGNEPNLMGYWRFDNGSGVRVEDVTGRGNNGTLGGKTTPPLWQPSTAPISNEAGAVYNILGGIQTSFNRTIEGLPSVLEYADLESDAYGAVFSVMKRFYAFRREGRLELLTGFKVGDLDTIYMGQAQSKPSLIGYIEGAPPIPSENQTLPYWTGGPSDLNSYAGATTVQFQEADNIAFSYNVDKSDTTNNAFGVRGGLKISGQWGVSTGLVVSVDNPVGSVDGKLGLQTQFEFGSKDGSAMSQQTSKSRTLTSALTPGGTWEAGTKPEEWLNSAVGRRYSPNNVGYALVKSLTVDVYASVLRSTGTMVAISSVPNQDIPADVNIIDFPINPYYVKNGTLDGKVGLKNDPNYLNADLVRGSYFKPVEAYALKRKIERDEKQLEAYYLQYSVGGMASKLKDSSNWDDYRSTLQNGAAYDWAKHLSKRNIVNTYVWTAGGGRYAEEEACMNVYTESYTGTTTSLTGVGAALELNMAFPVVGFYLEFDYMHSSSTEVNVVKQKDQSAGFTLTSSASPDPYLYPAVYDGTDVVYGPGPAEGKVDAYRYLSFFLAPSQDNFKEFFGEVVDPEWLRSGRQPNAVALSEATAADNGVWRVMHRVTYVSRIPRKFQPVPDASSAPVLDKPVGLARNATLVSLVKAQIVGTSPTTIEIGEAVAKVLGKPGDAGILGGCLPWWADFLEDTKDFKLPAAEILRALREDLLNYIIADYATA